MTSKSSIRSWGVLYKFGVYVRKKTRLTSGDLRGCPQGLDQGQPRLNAAQESAEGIVPDGQAMLVRHSNAERRSQQLGGAATPSGKARTEYRGVRDGKARVQSRPSGGRAACGRNELVDDPNGKPTVARRSNGTARYVIRPPGGVGGGSREATPYPDVRRA